MNHSDLLQKLYKRLEKERRNHPSFLLMQGTGEEGSIDRDLLKKGSAILNQNLRGTCGGNICFFNEFVVKTWEENRSNVVYVKGDGGTGKTVAMLTFAIDECVLKHNIPVIYIPVHDLNNREDDLIDAYLNKNFRLIRNEIEELANTESKENRPSLFLIIDGMNEVDHDTQSCIERDIQSWAIKDGVFIVVASRFVHSAVLNRIDFELQHIDKETAVHYLKTVLAGKVTRIPNRNNSIYKVLDTPLMLNLYVQIETYQKTFNDDSYLDWHDSDSKGNIIWNYLQRELQRCANLYGQNSRITLPEYALLILCIAPYICYQMERKNQYEIYDYQAINYIKEGYCYWRLIGNDNMPKQIKSISIDSAQAINWVDATDPQFEQKILDLLYVLTKEIVLFCEKKGRRQYVLMHQNFIACLAAVHLKNVLSVFHTELPLEFRYSISAYAADYLSDLINKSDLFDLWKINRETVPVNPAATHNILRVYNKKDPGNLSALSWNGMDLRGINLYSYRNPYNGRLSLSRNPAYFNKTRLSTSCFHAQGHTDDINFVSFSHDGKKLVSCSDDKTICIWDTETHLQIGIPLVGHTDFVNSAIFSKDDQFIISCSDDCTIRIWDTASFSQIGSPLTGHTDWVNAVAISDVDREIVSCSDDKTIRIWNMDTHEQIGEPLLGHTDIVNSVAFSPDGKMIASGASDTTVRLWDIKSRKEICKPLEGHEGIVTCVVFDRKENRLFSGSADGMICIWDLETKKQIGKPLRGHMSAVNTIFQNKDCTSIISGGYDRSIRTWNMDTHEQIGKTMTDHDDLMNCIALGNDDKTVASCSKDMSICFWNLDEGSQIGAPVQKVAGRVTAVTFFSDSSTIIAGSDDGLIRFWDLEHKKQIRSPLTGHTDRVLCLDISADKRIMVSGSADKTIRLWNTETHEQIDEPLTGHEGSVNTVSINQKVKRIISGSDDRSVRIWNLDTGRRLKAPSNEHTNYVNSVAFTKDGKTFFSASEDTTIRIWNTEKFHAQRRTLAKHRSGVIKALPNDDGSMIVSASEDGVIRLWYSDHNYKSIQISDGENERIKTIAVSPKFRLVASASYEGTIFVRKIEQNITPIIRKGHTDTVNSLAFSPNGKKLVSGSDDGTIRVWRAAGDDSSSEAIYPLFGIDLTGLDLSQAELTDVDKVVLSQNGIKVK